MGLHHCVGLFSSCREWGLLFIAARRLLVAVASHCGARALGHDGFHRFGTWAQLVQFPGSRAQAP